jgi:GntR family transcriptional regulator, transcriptional repressor for pyruvate dehydrogenase complex
VNEVLDAAMQGRLGANAASGTELLSSWLAEQIERLVIDRGLKSGDRLPSERELASSFGVSRSVVRDAVGALEQRGLVRARTGSGIYVSDGGKAAVADVLGHMLRREVISLPELMETRRLMEIHNAGMAAHRATPEAVDALAAALDRQRSSAGPRELVETDVAFHEILSQAASNKVLAMLLSSLRPLLMEGMFLGTVLEGSREAAIGEHTSIFEAVRAHDADAARGYMSGHLERSYREWEEAGYLASGSSGAGTE